MAREPEHHTRCARPAGKRFSLRLVVMTSLAPPAAPVLAWADQTGPPVDLELVLAADVSGSMTEEELRVQREGYVNALRNVAVITATLSGARGRIAIAIGPFYDGLAGGGTSISGALSFASRLLQMSGLKADRQVIDVSGDGVNNCGAPVAPIRDAVIAQGATINGLAISPLQSAADGNTDSFGQPTLEWYYKSRVIGGPRAFVITVGDRADIENAIQRKLVLEIAGARHGSSSPRRAFASRCCFSTGRSPGR